MAQQTYNVSEDMHLEIRNGHERITVTGWDQAKSAVTDAPARQEGNTLLIENTRKVTVRVPRTASVTITECEADIRIEDLAGRVELSHVEGDVVLRGLAQAVLCDIQGDLVAKGLAVLTGEGTWEGDAALRGITERLEVNEMEGDLSLGDMGAVVVHNLDGDLSARGIRGSFQLGDVDGDVDLRNLEGDLNIAHVDGDFVAAGVRGAVDVPEVEGDTIVSLEEVHSVILRADGDVVLNLPADANADIEADAPHGGVVAHGNMRVTEREENHLRGALGSGGAPVRIESLHDDVIVRTGPAQPHAEYGPEFRTPFVEMGQDLAEMGRRIAEETRRSVEESLAGFGVHHHGRRWEERHEPEPEAPRGPVAGSAERKAILDAIARGELSVDEAIRKINGEE